jgi:hypothetical protein
LIPSATECAASDNRAGDPVIAAPTAFAGAMPRLAARATPTVRPLSTPLSLPGTRSPPLIRPGVDPHARRLLCARPPSGRPTPRTVPGPAGRTDGRPAEPGTGYRGAWPHPPENGAGSRGALPAERTAGYRPRGKPHQPASPNGFRNAPTDGVAVSRGGSSPTRSCHPPTPARRAKPEPRRSSQLLLRYSPNR